MRALRPRVAELTAGLLDDLAAHGSPADLHRALALSLPIQVICELLGVPYADRDQFRAWSEAVGDSRDRARSEQGLGELFVYGQQLVARKHDQPGDDFISRLCAGSLGDDEIAMLSMALLFAGHETTVVAIGMGALCLLANPGQQQALIEDPGQITTAAEEILRPGPDGGGIPRYARTSLRIGEVTVRAGDLVLLDTRAANHDPAVFPAPIASTSPARARLISRSGTAPTTASAPRSPRIELQAVFSQLLVRFPAMRLAVPLEQLRMRSSTVTGGLTSLPVQW
jgi:pentalenolactone synthase